MSIRIQLRRSSLAVTGTSMQATTGPAFQGFGITVWPNNDDPNQSYPFTQSDKFSQRAKMSKGHSSVSQCLFHSSTAPRWLRSAHTPFDFERAAHPTCHTMRTGRIPSGQQHTPSSETKRQTSERMVRMRENTASSYFASVSGSRNMRFSSCGYAIANVMPS